MQMILVEYNGFQRDLEVVRPSDDKITAEILYTAKAAALVLFSRLFCVAVFYHCTNL
jgi:hypothetical protein